MMLTDSFCNTEKCSMGREGKTWHVFRMKVDTEGGLLLININKACNFKWSSHNDSVRGHIARNAFRSVPTF